MTRRKRTRADADEGVRRCMALMAEGLWVAGKSHAAVAKQFGVAEATVKDWATSASRVLRLSVEGDREDIRARMLTTLDAVIAKAMKRDLRTAVAAIEAQAKLLGLVVQKHEVAADVTHSSGDDLAIARSVVAALESSRGGSNGPS